MDSNSINEMVHAALKKALKTRERKEIAQECGLEYHTLSAFLRRKTASVTTVNALYTVLNKHGYIEPTTAITARYTPSAYQFLNATEKIIAKELCVAADILNKDDLPVSMKIDKLRYLLDALPAYITALNQSVKREKKRKSS